MPNLNDYFNQVANAMEWSGVDFNSLVNGGLAALLVYWLTTRRDRRKAQEATEAERNGLLELLDLELYQNVDKLQMIRDNPDVGEQYRLYAELHTQIWDESKVRLVQMLPTEHRATLFRYYGLLQRLGVTIGDKGTPKSRRVERKPLVRQRKAVANARRENLLSVYAREALEYGDKAREMGGEYIGSLPDYYALYEGEAEELSQLADPAEAAKNGTPGDD